MNNDYKLLIDKLKGFIRKYYQNLIIRGLIFSLSIILVLFLAVDMVEYYAWTSVLARTILFYSLVASAFFVFVFYVIIPGFHLLNIGNVISGQQAAKIIGEHFPEVSDKLLNTLQLKMLAQDKNDKGELQLLEASIEQRSARLNPIPFKKAIDLKKNVRHLRYFIPPLLIILIILVVSPAFIIEPSRRLVNYTTAYAKPLPYQLSILNEKLEALQHDDFTVVVKAGGEEIPSRIMINDGNFSIRMAETSPGIYEYTFKDINRDIHFHLLTDDFKSSNYHVKVFPKPIIYSFDVVLDFPNYLQKKNEVVENSGDLIVPEGTRLKWNIYTKDTRHIYFKTDKGVDELLPTESNVFKVEGIADRNFYYSLTAENKYVINHDSMSFSVQVIKDEYPSIEVTEHQEESIYGFANFNGNISDDHGFNSLKFYYRKDNSAHETYQVDKLKIDPSVPGQYFNYSIQADDYGLLPGESMTYYFEVRDNDAYNGYKRTKSTTFYLHLPDESELEDNIDDSSEKIKELLKEAMNELDQVNMKLEEMQMSLFEKQELSWLDKKQLSELLKKEEALQEKVAELNQMNQEISAIEELLEKTHDPELEDKLSQLEEMFEKLDNEELKKKIEELLKELENLDKDKLNDYLDKIKKENEQLKNDLEQNLELYKQLEFEKKIQEATDKLKELAKEQQELAGKTGEKEITKEQSLKEQDSIQKEFSEIEKDLQKAEELNQDLEEPFDVGAKQEDIDAVKQDMNNAEESLQKGKQKKASGNQSDASSKMEEMANSLSMQMQGAMESRMGEDAEQMKKMLDNLVDLSFGQEALMDQFRQTSQNDPLYVKNIDQLKLLQDDFEIVHDSLIALSKRQMMVQPFIIKESDKVNSYMERALKSMQERRKGRALSEQQYAMTSTNNLALMLAESLDKMQQSMQMQGKDGGMACPNPGQGKPSLKQMGEMQQQMNQGMKEGSEKDGLGGKDGMNGNSEELARMAAAQREIRKRLQDYIEQIEGEGGNGSQLSKLLDEMKKSEDDIINRRITQETFERQKQIEVRLLKSEKAQQEREKEKKRESTAGINRKKSNLNNKLQYNDKSENQEEILITAPIELSPYYRELLKKYLYKLEQENVNE